MRSFASPSFFRVFDMLVNSSNHNLTLSQWSIDGVDCERDRHSFTSPKYGLTVEVFTLTKPGKRGWSLIVVKEYWWAGKEKDVMRMPHWAKLNSGDRSDVLGWFRAQELAFEKSLSSHTTPHS
jgi:hypothetical protein